MRVPSAVGCHHDPGLRLASCVTSLTERVCHVTAWMGQVGVKGKLSSVGVEDVSKPAALVPTCAVRLTFPDEARAAAALPRVNAARRGSLVTRAVYDKSRSLVGITAARMATAEYPWSRPGATATTILVNPQWPDEFPFSAEHLKRIDETPDTQFYQHPRIGVHHIDESAQQALQAYYKQALPKGGAV